MSKPPTPGEPLSEMFSQAPHQILGQAAHSQDTIYLRNLRLPAVVGPDAWGRPGKTQPVIISMSLFLDTSQTGSSDDLSQSFSYGQMSRDVMAILDGRDFEGVDHLILELAKAARFWPGEAIRSHISLPKAFLRVDGGFSREVTLAKQPEGQWLLLSSECVIKGMKASCIIGINPHERQEKQAVSIDLTVPFMCGDLDQADAIKVENLQAMVKQVLLVSYPILLHVDRQLIKHTGGRSFGIRNTRGLGLPHR